MALWHRYYFQVLDPESYEEIADFGIKDGNHKETARNAVKRYVKKTGRAVVLAINSIKTENILESELFEPEEKPETKKEE